MNNPIQIPDAHFVNGNPVKPPFAEGLEQAVFGMGCFWGVERRFWETTGVHATASGYAGGATPHATLYASMIREIATKGKDARVEKVDRGQFQLRKGA